MQLDCCNHCGLFHFRHNPVILTRNEIVCMFCIRSYKKRPQFENNQQTRPFEGTILIKFVYHDKQGRECVENKYSTVIVFKDKENFITNSKGQFYDNMFIDKIMSYLKVSRFKFNDKKSFIKDKKNDKTNNREIC